MTITSNTPEGRKGQEGFSLVELAIVLIIIGLIVGGVLKGQDLIESARVNSINTQLNEVRVAASTFNNKYDSLPGDMLQTNEALIPGWVTAGVGTAGTTRGNGLIEGNRMGSTASEGTLFWQHVRAAGLVTGVTTQNAGTLALTEGMAARVGGIYTVQNDTQNGVTAAWVQLGTNAAAGATNNDKAILTPLQLRGLDVKGDDGAPNTGSVGGRDGTTTTNGCVTAGGAYATTATVQCYAMFKL